MITWDNVAIRIDDDLVTYVDNLRAIGFYMEHVWAIARMVASWLEFLGIHDAPRKQRIDNSS